MNARSLKNKLCAFHSLLYDDYLAVSVVESWLDSSVTDNMIDTSGRYTVYRNDRITRQGGGVSCLITKLWPSYLIPIPEKFKALEIIAVTILTDIGSLRYITVYRPPEFNKLGREYIVLLVECLEYLCDTRDTVILVGDLNLPHLDWSLLNCPDDHIHSLFLEFCTHHGLHQFVTSPTRDDHILDLVLSNDHNIVSDLQVVDNFSHSDHCMVEFSLIVGQHEDCSNMPIEVFDYDNADYDGIACFLLNDLFLSCPEIDACETVDQVWANLVEPLNVAVQLFVPRKTVCRRSLKKARWRPRHIRRALNKKRLLWRHYRKDKTLMNKSQYQKQCAFVKKLIYDYNLQVEQSVINKANLGTFYRFVNGKLSCKSGVGPLKSESGNMIINDVKKAEALNDYFTSIFTVDNGVLPDFVRRVGSDVFISHVQFSAADVVNAMKHMSNSKTRDPQNFNSCFLKRLKFVLAKPLSAVFAHIFSTGVIPSAWRTANVTPIFKKGVSSDVANYRPISLTSLFSKVFERIIKQQMLAYLLDNNLITRQQFGFLSKCSTCTQLLDSVNDWTLSVRNRHNVDVIYFDFAKAFDSVSHPKLIAKLQAYGVCDDLLAILSDFLSDRTQRVVLPNGTSTFRSIISGVPQGSVLGPVLFLIYINDIVDIFDGSDVCVKLYADDIKIYLDIKSESDGVVLQSYIDKIHDWSLKWQLQLADNKCQHSHIGLSTSVNPVNYYVSDVKLPTVDNVRDLGVLIDSQLTFRDHISSIVSRGHLRARQIWRCFLCKDASVLCKAFVTYVRPLLEYCSPVWSPVLITYVNKLESVQRRFTKQLPGFQSLSYDERCALLGIDRLELRRLLADLILCYKIINGLVLLSADSFFTILRDHRTRGHSLKLLLPDSRINCRQHFFAIRVVKVWNSLPDKVVSADHLTMFINLLKRVDLNKFLVGKI